MNLREVLAVVPTNIPVLILRGIKVVNKEHVAITYYAHSLYVQVTKLDLTGFKTNIEDIEVIHHSIVKSGREQAIVMLVNTASSAAIDELLEIMPTYRSLLLLEDDATIVSELHEKPEVFLPLTAFLFK